MKYKFGDTSLVTTYIKELLHSFNLPTVDAYNKDTVLCEEKIHTINNKLVACPKVYIKDNYFVKYTTGEIRNNQFVKYDKPKFEKIGPYVYNKPILNNTTTYTINSSSYDITTHEYLGNYLRFIRDYKGLNLMPLYNCFSGKQPTKIVRDIKFDNFTLNLDTTNTGYTYYIVPVKFNKDYTIALDASISFEMMCIINTSAFLEENEEENTSSKTKLLLTATDTLPDCDKLVKQTYVRVNGSTFNKPFIFSTKCNASQALWDKEKSLYLLIKLPSVVDSTITVLEGDYRYSTIDGAIITNYVINGDECDKNKQYVKQFPTKLSLLAVDDKKQHPFADRLVEYLMGQAVTEIDEISSNVLRTQLAVYNGDRTWRGYVGEWTDVLTQAIYDRVNSTDITRGNKQKTHKVVYTGNLNATTTLQRDRTFIDNYQDLLYRLDKDTETFFRAED